MEKKKLGICANCRKEMDIGDGSKALCGTCVNNLPTAKFNSRIKV